MMSKGSKIVAKYSRLSPEKRLNWYCQASYRLVKRGGADQLVCRIVFSNNCSCLN